MYPAAFSDNLVPFLGTYIVCQKLHHTLFITIPFVVSFVFCLYSSGYSGLVPCCFRICCSWLWLYIVYVHCVMSLALQTDASASSLTQSPFNGPMACQQCHHPLSITVPFVVSFVFANVHLAILGLPCPACL